MDEIQIPEGAAFRIQLGTFEGPLDLLLHLIKKHELDILDLPIAFVTERYLDYLSMMQELDLDVASEYLLMAATLAHIKSKMLLPQNPVDEVEEHEEGYVADPRAELIKRLLEYQKYRSAAEQLGARPIAGRDVFGRGAHAEEAQGPAPLAPIDLYKLLDAFGAILKRVKGRVALEVTAEQITIGERISQLSDMLRTRRSCVFDELFAKDRTRYEVVVTFLALLEMTKLRITRIFQTDPAAPLHIQYALLDAEAPTVPPEAEVAAAFASEPVDLNEAARAETFESDVEAEDAFTDEAPSDEFETDADDEGGFEAEADDEALETDLEADAALETEVDDSEALESEAASGDRAADETIGAELSGLSGDFAESEPLVSDFSLDERADGDAAEVEAATPEPEPDDDAVETGGLEYDALQPDLSAVDAMEGIFEEPAEVPEPDPDQAPPRFDSEPPVPEATEQRESDTKDESSNEDADSDREPPV
jgi:segregation and condensation protein A